MIYECMLTLSEIDIMWAATLYQANRDRTHKCLKNVSTKKYIFSLDAGAAGMLHTKKCKN